MSEQNLIETARDVIAASMQPSVVGKTPIVVLPDNHHLASLDDYLLEPTRKTGTAALHTVDSLIAYVNDHKRPESRIFIDADYESGRIACTAVIDEHRPGAAEAAGWRQHRAEFTPRRTTAWKEWLSNNKNKMSQQGFGNFLEYRLNDIVAPDGTQYPAGAAVLEFALNLAESKKVHFRQGTNLQNGNIQLEFIADDDDQTKGRLEAFRAFCLGLQPFQDADAYQVEAKLRYRITNDGGLHLWYELQQPEKVLEAATRDIVTKIVEGCPDVPILHGAA